MTSFATTSRTRRVALFASGMAVGVAGLFGAFLATNNLIGPGPSPSPLGAPSFVEVESLIAHTYDGDFQYFVGGGVAVFDCDEDQLPDVFLAGGENPAALYRNESVIGGDLRFERVTQPATDLDGVTGAYPLDVDSDGHMDLAVLRVGENSMLRGLGGCRFERANEDWGVLGGQDWTVAFSAMWEPSESVPTLAFGNYLAIGEDGERTNDCEDHFLFRPVDGTYASPTRIAPGWCALSFLFSDWARSGSPDLRMTNDRHYYREGEEQLWRFGPGREPEPYTREDGWEQMQIWGMGIASQDVTGDGLPEIFLTSQGDNKLQTLSDGPDLPTYEDIALTAGANAHKPFQGDTDRPSTAWHAEFDDVNNDGYLDLFVTKGNVDAMPEFAQADPNNLLLGQPQSQFVEAAGDAGLIDFARSRGAAVTDLNLDGLLDVIVIDRAAPVRVWRNVGAGDAAAPEQMGNWLAIELVQAAPNRDAIGAWIEVRTDRLLITREITLGGGHAGGETGWIHLGLGDSAEADIRVQWPDGEVGPWMTLDAGRFWIVERGVPSGVEWAPLQD